MRASMRVENKQAAQLGDFAAPSSTKIYYHTALFNKGQSLYI